MTPIARNPVSLAVAAALLSTSVLAPSVAFAVPVGGYADLVEQVSPSVVYIEVTSAATNVDFSQALPEGMPDELRRRFEGLTPKDGQQGARSGLGSGFIISADGTIVTNHHVIAGAERVMVKLTDGRNLQAVVVGSDPLTDIALLKIESEAELPFIDFGVSADMRAGDEVFAVGNPFGLGGTVTSGIVSATSRNINSGPFDDFIQTDASINRGNSGGPLFNNDGQVVGVNTAIYSPDGGSVGIGFAVPSDLVQTIVADLQDDGTVTRGWLGVQIRQMTDEVASVLGYDAPRGAVIEAVSPDSPAAEAGLANGDIILSFGDTDIVELRDLSRAVAETKPDAVAQVVVLHKGAETIYEVTIGTLNADAA